MKRLLAVLILATLLAACSGTAQYNADCAGDLDSGYTCSDLSVVPYVTSTPMPTSTPLPPTTGTFTLGSTFDQYLQPDTDISWTIVTSPGPVHFIDFGSKAVVMSATELGDYVIEARWVNQGITYTAPFTLTITS